MDLSFHLRAVEKLRFLEVSENLLLRRTLFELVAFCLLIVANWGLLLGGDAQCGKFASPL